MSNTIHMQARLGKDPETREVGETTVTRLWLAESERFKRKDGERVEQTNWWAAEFWGRRGEVVAEHFKKGDGIVLRGSIRQREQEEKTYYTIRVDDWEFPMSRRGDGESPAAKASGVPYDNYTPSGSDDDVPF